MPAIRLVEPPASARRDEIFKQARDARFVAAELRRESLRLRAIIEGRRDDGDDRGRGELRRSA